jgi:carboxypeptidase C (cathepsin A)
MKAPWPRTVPQSPKFSNPSSRPVPAVSRLVAYFKNGELGAPRPVTFLYNGGPGSSTVWLHMGAFGPRRVVTADNSHTPAAPYPILNNEFSLLDASDLVFVDAPGTGFSRIAGKDREKSFYGVDADAEAFADFVSQFLAKYGRWNSPKYLFGESYGTTRSAVLINLLETGRSIDFNGVIMLSQWLNCDINADTPQFNPGIDLPYQLALPTYAATAWYYHKLPDPPKELGPFLAEVQHFAMNEYAVALGAGAALSPEERRSLIRSAELLWDPVSRP